MLRLGHHLAMSSHKAEPAADEEAHQDHEPRAAVEAERRREALLQHLVGVSDESPCFGPCAERSVLLVLAVADVRAV